MCTISNLFFLKKEYILNKDFHDNKILATVLPNFIGTGLPRLIILMPSNLKLIFDEVERIVTSIPSNCNSLA